MDNQLRLQLLRTGFISCLFFLIFSSYLAPIFIAKYLKSQAQSPNSPIRAIQKLSKSRLVSVFNCVSLGVLLATSFLVILPNVKDNFKTIFPKARFPIAEFVVVSGFLITLIIEQWSLYLQEKADSHHRDDAEQNQGLLEECEMQDLSEEPSYLGKDRERQLSPRTRFPSKSPRLDCEEAKIHDDPSDSNRSVHGHGHNHMTLLVYEGSGSAYFILVLSCGLHSIFEGITLGLQTNTSKAVHLFLGMVTHECFMAGALGVSSTKLKYSFRSYIKYALLISAFVPAGIITGILVEHTPGTIGEFISAMLQGVSAGIFIHVTFQDFMPSEFSNTTKTHDKMVKTLSVLLGFIVMLGITYYCTLDVD